MKNLLASKRFQLGFTLIELLIVVAIIAVLVSVGAFSYSTAMRNARDAQRKADLKKIALALEKYYTDNGRYPPGNAGGALAQNSQSYNAVSPWIPGLSSYMTDVPRDPVNTSSPVKYYQYDVFNSGQNYIMTTNLENDGDRDRRDLSVSPIKSPCNEQPWFNFWGSYKNFPTYDWCISDPK